MEFEMKPYEVYVQTDDANRIIAIYSDVFIVDAKTWTQIDKGYGDRYHHAQGNYFDKPIMDWRGIYRYKLVDGKPVERTQEEMDADYVQHAPVPTTEERMTQIERALIELAALMGG